MQRIYFSVLLLFALIPLIAQEPKVSHEELMAQMQAERMVYLTKELQLSEAEQKVVGEYLVQMDQEKVKRYRAILQKRVAMEKKKNLTKEDLQEYFQFRCTNKTAIEEYERNCFEKLSQILSPQKVLRLDKAQRVFLREVHKRRRQQK